MHLFVLALPITVVLLGVICYKRYARGKNDPPLEDGVVEGYYVYPAPFPNQSAVHSAHHWTAPGAFGAYGTPQPTRAFAHGPIPSQSPSCNLTYSGYAQKNSTLLTPSTENFNMPSPNKAAGPGASSGTVKIASEKTMVRDIHHLHLPEEPLPRNTSFPPRVSEDELSKRELHGPNPIVAREQENMNDKLVISESKTQEFSTPLNLSEEISDALMLSRRASTSRNNSIDSFTVSMRIPSQSVSPHVFPGPVLQTIEPNEASPKMLPNRPVTQEFENDGPNWSSEEALPQYNPEDEKLFLENNHPRQSLKQDHSYIGRLRESYQAPPTVSVPKKETKNDNLHPNSKSNANSEPKM